MSESNVNITIDEASARRMAEAACVVQSRTAQQLGRMTTAFSQFGVSMAQAGDSISAFVSAFAKRINDASVPVAWEVAKRFFPLGYARKNGKTALMADLQEWHVALLDARLLPWSGWSPAWETETASGLARQMLGTGDYTALPILADAIQDAGCEDAALLSLMRNPVTGTLDLATWWLVERLTAG